MEGIKQRYSIVYFLDYGKNFGGANITLIRQAALMKQEGHEVILFLSDYLGKGMQEKYEEVIQQERNRDRQEYRFYSVCTECGLLTKTQKEWPFVKTVGFSRQIRIPVERDEQGNDITPDTKTFLEKGSDRKSVV